MPLDGEYFVMHDCERPISSAQMATFEAKHALTLPADVRDFILRHNGGSIGRRASFKYTLPNGRISALTPSFFYAIEPECDYADIERPLRYGEPEIREMFRRFEFLPICSLGIGDDVLVSCAPDSFGHIYVLDPPSVELRGPTHGSFSEALESLTLDDHFVNDSRWAGLGENFRMIVFGAASEIRRSLSQLDLAARSRDGSTLLHMAVRASRPDIVEVLLGVGADVARRDNRRDTPLHEAAYDNADSADLLVKAGAEVDPRNDNGDTPLMIAASGGYLKCTLRLLKLGANPWLTNSEGQTVQEQCSDEDVQKVVAAFLS